MSPVRDERASSEWTSDSNASQKVAYVLVSGYGTLMPGAPKGAYCHVEPPRLALDATSLALLMSLLWSTP